MKTSEKKPPAPVIRQRPANGVVYEDLLGHGVAPWLADILARRMESAAGTEAIFSPSLAGIGDPAAIPDMDKAVARIVAAIRAEERMILAVDHDLDGTASAAVLWTALVDHFGVDRGRIEIVTSHRLTEGYGITLPVVERILASGATLIVSADKGSSDQPRIAMLAEAGRDVVVTDHHAVPVEGPPESACAVVNPTRSDSRYDPHVCGAAVAFLLMAKVRSALLEQGDRAEIPSLAGIVDYVAVATIADCVALRPDRSYANRAFIRRGLAMLNRASRPCWAVMQEHVNGPIRTDSIAFQLAPPIAAAGRLDWPETGFRFLTAGNVDEARTQWAVLQRENALRKEIEKNLRRKAVEAALGKQTQSLVLFFEDGHSGVHGITASRLVETFGKPAAIFSPKGAGARSGEGEILHVDGRRLASGSFRGIAGFHVRDALQHVADRHPGLLLGFGGHEGAAGATIATEDFGAFVAAYEEATRSQLGTEPLRPVLWVDAELEADRISLDTLDRLLEIEPWGKDFPFPLFSGEFEILSASPVGDGSHLRLQLGRGGRKFPAIWFNAVETPGGEMPVSPGGKARLVYRLTENRYRGARDLQLNIVALDVPGEA